MAVSLLDTPAVDEGNNTVTDFSVSAGSNRWLLVLSSIGGVGDTMDAISWGGVAMRLLFSTTESSNGDTLYVWGLNESEIDSASGNAFTNETYTGSPAGTRMSHVVLSVQDALQTDPTVTNSNVNDTNNPTTTTLTGLDGAFGIAMMRANTTGVTWTWNNSFTSIYDSTGVTAKDDTAAYKVFSGSGTQTPSVTGTATNGVMAALRIDPAATGGIILQATHHLRNNTGSGL